MNMKLSIAISMMLTPLAAMPLLAQDEAASVGLEEVIVTAQRREQSLQEVPVSVTAFTADQLEKSNIKEASQ